MVSFLIPKSEGAVSIPAVANFFPAVEQLIDALMRSILKTLLRGQTSSYDVRNIKTINSNTVSKIETLIVKIGNLKKDKIKGLVICKISMSISTAYLPFRILIFPPLLFPCERINCAHRVKVLALKNDAPGVSQFKSTIENPKPLDLYVVIPSAALPTWVSKRCLR